MALKEYLGAVILEIDGQEVEIESYDVTVKTGRKLVKTMNKTGRPSGFCKGVEEIDIKVTAVIPTTGDIDWLSIKGAKLTIYPITAGGKRTSYLDCFTTDAGEKYVVDGEAKRDISLNSLHRVVE
jgi:hypothetical protein